MQQGNMMIPTAIRDKTAICGVGMTRIGRYPDRNALSLASEIQIGMLVEIVFDDLGRGVT